MHEHSDKLEITLHLPELSHLQLFNLAAFVVHHCVLKSGTEVAFK